MKRYLITKQRLHIFRQTTELNSDKPTHWTLCGLPSRCAKMKLTDQYIGDMTPCALCANVERAITSPPVATKVSDETEALPLFEEANRVEHESLAWLLESIDL